LPAVSNARRKRNQIMMSMQLKFTEMPGSDIRLVAIGDIGSRRLPRIPATHATAEVTIDQEQTSEQTC
jgi:hypothetical protein